MGWRCRLVGLFYKSNIGEGLGGSHAPIISLNVLFVCIKCHFASFYTFLHHL